MLRALLMICFIVLGIFARKYSYFGVDLQISRGLQSIQSPAFSLLMNLVSELGDDFHLTLIIVSITSSLFYLGYRKESFKAMLSAALAVLVGTLTKAIVNRPRPDGDLVRIQEQFSDKSFPSLHVLIFTVFFGYLFYLSLTIIKTRWLKVLLASITGFLILTIGLSRIYLGAHWASDAVGGYLLGLLLISFIIAHAKR